MANKTDVITNFKLQTGKARNGSKCDGGGYNIFYEGRVLYSYGIHFPLAIRHADASVKVDNETEATLPQGFGCGIMYIINGDKYSISTGSHQREVIRSCKPNVQVPFSALAQAWNYTQGEERYLDQVRTNTGYQIAKKFEQGERVFKIVNYRQDTWTSKYRPDSASPWVDDESVWSGSYNDRWETHKLGAVLFTIRNISFLSSFDELDTRNYFLCHVPGSPASIDEAYEALKPKGVIECERSNHPILRQGDWFFLSCSEDKNLMRRIKNTELSSFRLGGTAGTHTVTRARKSEASQLYVQGTVRHAPLDNRRPEHKRLKLGDGKSWWVPVKNTSDAGWGAAGNVD